MTASAALWTFELWLDITRETRFLCFAATSQEMAAYVWLTGLF